MLMLLNSCGDSTTFSIKGEINEGGTQNMRAIYYADDKINLLTIQVKDGKFEFEAKLNAPTIIEFYTSNKALLGRAYVEPGDDIECVLYKNAPYKAQIEGNDVSQRWSQFLNDNADIIASGNAQKINEIIARYINANKNDVLSTLLLITEYVNPQNEKEATKLISTIALEARPQHLIECYELLLDRSNNVIANEKFSMTSYYSSTDSLKTFLSHTSSYSIITFSNGETRDNNAIADSMRAFQEKYHPKRLQQIDLSLDFDTLEWKKSIKNDSATWIQGWVVGAVSAHSIERLGITRLPFYVVVDSTGKQVYRGNQIDKATIEVDSCLKVHNKQSKK